MARILLAAHATVGHTNALRAIGRSFRANGDDVAMILPVVRAPALGVVPEVVKTAASIPNAVRNDGIELFGLRPAWSGIWHAMLLPRSRGYDELGHALGFFCAGLAAHARRVASVAESWRADVLVADYLFFAGWLGAKLAHVPFVAFYHSALPFQATGNPPFGSGLPNDAPVDGAWRQAERRLERLLAVSDRRVRASVRELGLDPPYSTDLNLLATLPELEPGLDPLDGPVVFAGPCLGGRSTEGSDHPALRDLPADKKRIYVSLGTVFNSNPDAFEPILRGLERQDWHVTVSAGPSAPRLERHPKNRTLRIFAHVPQVALLEHVDVVVTHGGNNTVQECLAAGRPMLVIPFGGDQLENARRVERLGAGIASLPVASTSQSVGAIVSRLLSEPRFAERAAMAKRALRSVDGTRRSVAAITALIRSGDRN
jgi:MGT family glycosyltransferase